MPTVRNLLAVVSDAASARITLHTAFRAARHLNCHVDALHVRSDPASALPLVGEAMSGAMVDEMMTMAEREADTRARSTRVVFDELSKTFATPPGEGPPRAEENYSATWMEEAGVEEQVVSLRACRADIVVLPRPTEGNETSALMTLNSALLQSGRPVIAAAPLRENESTGPYARIAVFWNGSAEATRAVAAALPFFLAAEQVIVLRVEEEEWFAPTDDLEAYLTRHGVRTIVSKVLPREGRTGRSLLLAARDVGADMMVMGAYTRSKLRQLILGSVTGFVMQYATLPVLLCH